MSLYKPWGPLPWLLSKLDRGREIRWSILGVSGTEERCASTLAVVGTTQRGHTGMLRIIDPEPADATAYEARLDEIAGTLRGHGVAEHAFARVNLLATNETIHERTIAFLDAAGPDLIIDVTSMPKWWFFPVVRFALADPRVRNLLVAYGSGAAYGSQLASNPNPLEPLPTFEARDGRTDHKELVVGIGFAPLELADLYAGPPERVRYLFPFPPGPPHFKRNWGFLQDLEERIGHEKTLPDDRWHVNMYDCPSVFEALARFTDDGRRTTALAPFGPKTVSLAMCLFALACEAAGRPSVPAFYTQPKRYSLDYTRGVRMAGGAPDVRGYALRLDGRDVYELQP